MGKIVTKSSALIVFVGLLGVIACASVFSSAHAPSTAITIVNNSSREIRAVYLSPDQNNWGPDQLGSSVIAAGGGSVTIHADCGGSSVKVIAEDHEGCFFYTVASCTSNSTWTISNASAPDCGSE
ncbi:MAG: hypothetical protein WAL47_13715 [Pyrinomonadaceae bacterium]